MQKFDKQSLQATLDNAIARYPTLYRLRNREQSELAVLAHTFISYGTGLEWHPDGLLCEWGDTFPVRVRLPKDFFEASLVELDVEPKELPRIREELGQRFYMRQPGRTCGGRAIGILVRWTSKEQAIRDVVAYSFDERLRKTPYVHTASGYPTAVMDAEHNADFASYWFPDKLCEYSPLQEMLDGQSSDKTGLPDIRRDWLDGALRIARVALAIVKDPALHQNSSYFPDRRNLHMYGRSAKDGKSNEQLIEQISASFASTIARHTDVLERFIAKFENHVTRR